MTGETVPAHLERMWDWWRIAAWRVVGQSRPGERYPAGGIPPAHRARRMALPAPCARLGGGKRDRHQLPVTHVALETRAPLGVRCERDVSAKALRKAATLMTGFAAAGLEFGGREPVRDPRWRARVGSQRAPCRQRPRMRTPARARRRSDGQHLGTRPKHFGLGGDRGLRCHRRRGLAASGRVAADGGDPVGRDDQRANHRGRRCDKENAHGHDARALATHVRPLAGSRSTRTAHAVVSGWPEIGQDASSRRRLAGNDSSKTGMNTWPREGCDR